MKNKKILYIGIIIILTMIILIGCSKEKIDEKEALYLNKSLEEIKTKFSREELGFKFSEEEMKNGLTKYSGKSTKGDAELILIGNKDEDKLSKAVMRGKVTPEDEEVSTYTGIYFLSFLDFIGDFEDGDKWLLEGMNHFINDEKSLYEKEINEGVIRLSTAEITNHLILEINPKK